MRIARVGAAMPRTSARLPKSAAEWDYDAGIEVSLLSENGTVEIVLHGVNPFGSVAPGRMIERAANSDFLTPPAQVISKRLIRFTPSIHTQGLTVLISSECLPESRVASIRGQTTAIIEELIESLPDPKILTSEERRGIIARYSSVLEGNFVYWMTAAVIAAKAEESRPILLGNLYEEVHDAHPHMLRKFALAANAYPTAEDALAVHADLTNVRLFLGQLSPVKSVLLMGFFEGFIQRFMAYLADLARAQGSTEMEYTDVHGVCDIEHTEGLFQVLAAEIALTPPEPDMDLFEGVNLLRTLIERIVRPQA